MVTGYQEHVRSSVHVAPLNIRRPFSRNESRTRGARSPYLGINTKPTNYPDQMTPPATPNASTETLEEQMEAPRDVFDNFLRAFYPFRPSPGDIDSTVTLPLEEGDVVLVHSIHTNGWADGTLLATGARGWLPTNYCETYAPEYISKLLDALVNFWDLLKCGGVSDVEIFANQEFMKGIVSGTRILLESAGCLTRETLLVRTNERIRRTRKALLAELSWLVRTAKRLPDLIHECPRREDDVTALIDEMILKALRITTRGINFLDIFQEEVPASAPSEMTTVMEERSIPPTPPADSTSFKERCGSVVDSASRRGSSQSSGSCMTGQDQTILQQPSKRLSDYSISQQTKHAPQPLSSQMNRSSVSHRVSLLAPRPSTRAGILVSEKLSSCHDSFLSYLASFIGRLAFHSQSATALLATIRSCVSSGRSLLLVVEAVCDHDPQSATSLENVKEVMYDMVNRLVYATRDILNEASVDEDDFVMPEDNSHLADTATTCVRAAGELVARTKYVMERIGDFEFEQQADGLGIDVGGFGTANEETERTERATSRQSSRRPTPPPLVIPGNDKPLPSIPLGSPASLKNYTLSKREPVVAGEKRTTTIPVVTKMSSPSFKDEYSPSEMSSMPDSEYNASSFRSGSLVLSNAGTSSTYFSSMRDSEASMLSQTSTRASTPDPSRGPGHQSDLSASGSFTSSLDDIDEVESKMLEKTFAHELVYNKDGQVSGGTLPALIEKLTLHDSTPDAAFASTFYLTFRLFVTPLKLAEALIERFDYVSTSPHIAGPVRLRVYNVFKGWLESHWRNLSDIEALPTIEAFAQGKLLAAIPQAGKRLYELTQRVTSADGLLVPRLVSSMGKTSTSTSQYVPPDTPLPPPVISKTQMNLLKNWRMGGTCPTILDFEPLEFARQLTIKGMAIFCSIMPEELLNDEWTKRTGSIAVNVRAMSTLATDITNLVVDTILHYDDAKKRALVIKHWIKIAQKSLELNNYDALMAIICSLNSSTILRLKKTWDNVSHKRQDMLKSLQAIVDSSKNHSVLRQRMANHVPPCLPFPGLYLTDLTFNNVGNPSTRRLPGENGMTVINFDKHMRTAKLIGDLQRFQMPYRLAEVPEIQEWIQAQIVRVKSSDQSSTQKYYRKSLFLEPRIVPAQKQSPTDRTNEIPVLPGQKEKFDLFGWTHSNKDKGVTPIAERHAATSTAPATLTGTSVL